MIPYLTPTAADIEAQRDEPTVVPNRVEARRQHRGFARTMRRANDADIAWERHQQLVADRRGRRQATRKSRRANRRRR